MAKLSKRMKTVRQAIDPEKVYAVDEAIVLLKSLPQAKFEESLDVSINLGIDTRRSDQTVRGSIVLPNGTGKSKRVAVFTTDAEKAKEAQDAGADLVESEEFLERLQKGQLDFDVLISTPKDMPKLAKFGQLLGPRGLMPNPKVGTVGADLALLVSNVKKGQVTFRADKSGIVHCRVASVQFDADKVAENIYALLGELRAVKPASQKGVYIKKATLSTTMGAGLRLDVSSLTT